MTSIPEPLRAREFPWAERGDCVYLNNASTGPLPARTVTALAAFNALRAQPYRIGDTDEMDILDRARRAVAQLVGATPAEIALMVNTSYGINLAARTLGLRAGDVIVAPDREFPANVYPWMALEREGIRFERVPCDALGCPDEDALLRALNRPEVRLLTVSWVSFASGYRVDLAALGRACRSRGIWFVVDGIQGVGALPIDLHALDVDILACGGQKWLLSPWGSGFVYVRESLVRQLAPSAVGWLAVRGGDDYSRLVDYDLTWRDDARRFEVITLPYQDMLGLATSVELLLEVGTERIGAHVQSLVDEAVRWAQRRRDVRLITPADRARRAGVVSIAPPDPVAVSARLNAAGVSHSLREGAIRLSPHCYNTSEEMERSLELMR